MRTVADIAQEFKVTPPTVRKWIRNGLLKADKIRGKYQIKETELARVMGA